MVNWGGNSQACLPQTILQLHFPSPQPQFYVLKIMHISLEP